MGRAGGRRASGRNTLTGMASRWSEHVRELEAHRNGTVTRCRRRRRYDSLKFGIWNSCLIFIILTSAHPDEIVGAEAVAITLAQTRANGHELKQFNRRRQPRGRKPGHRSRPSGGCRRTAKKTSIRHSLELWGFFVSERGRQLEASHRDGLLAEYKN